MGETRKIMITLPDTLLKEVDDIICIENKNRSEFIREAMKVYIREKRRVEIRETLKRGYIEMANINLTLAECALTESATSADCCCLDIYEAVLSESE